MVVKSIENYFQSGPHKPFFMIVGDDEYLAYKTQLAISGDITFLRLSNCCPKPDKAPDLDKLREMLRMADIDCKTNKIVLLGLGEYLALEGTEKATTFLTEMINFNLGSARVAFLLRGVDAVAGILHINDPRLFGRQMDFANETSSALSFVFSSLELGLFPDTGFQKALAAAEDGAKSIIRVNSALEFPNSTYPVQILKNPYEALRKKIKGFSIPKSMGTDEQWEALIKEFNQEGSLEQIFKKRAFDLTLSDFYENISGIEYRHWLYFLFLLMNQNQITNTYLKMILQKCTGFDDFKYQVLNAISEISHKARDFQTLYNERKKLVSQYPESDIALFVSNNRMDPEESVYKLTDNTLVEQEEIISYIAQHGMPDHLESIYPALAMYLKPYHFQGDALNSLLTEYFDEYKKQKLANTITDDFLKKVDDLAESRDYNRLRTRDELIAGIDPESTFLCWIDALGVEYLSYIMELAQKKGLAVSVSVGRADLPTLTSINKKFFETWPDQNKRKIEDLDDVKHKEAGGYKYGPSNLYPIHLAKELRIISDAVDEAATDLGLHKYDRYIIASDHGASRLAVIRRQEEKYDANTNGMHSGRCCEAVAGYELSKATEENGYLVLADYGRFKGSRAANVEVHGGASLEEVVVPVITLSLRDNSINIQIVEKTLKADYKTGVKFTLYVNKPLHHPVSVEYKGNRYPGTPIDANHYQISIPDIKRACTVEADVYIGEDLISRITIHAVGKSASVESDFDALF